jgi:hypothetical protein
LNLTDLSVKTRDSLSPGNKNFNPSEWLGQLLELKAEMALIEEDIALAEEVNESIFVIPAAVV